MRANAGGVVVKRWGRRGKKERAAQTGQAAAVSRPAEQSVEAAAVGFSAPLDREWIDIARPWLRGLGGLLLVGLSSNAVIRATAEFLRPLLVDSSGKDELISVFFAAVPVGILWGMLAALVVFVGQVVCGEVSLIGYLFFFVPDVAALVWWQLPGWSTLLARGDTASQVVLVIAVAISVSLAVVTAHYGEVLLFGPRRRALMSWLWSRLRRLRLRRRRRVAAQAG